MSTDIKTKLAKEKFILGTKETVKQLKLNKVSEVYHSSNTPKAVVEDLTYYAGFNKVPVIALSQNNEGLAILAKRKHPISVLCFLK